MNLRRRQKLLATCLQPALASVGLALWAVPVTAAVVGDGRAVAAVSALIEMPAQSGGATARDGAQHLHVMPGDTKPEAAMCSWISRRSLYSRSTRS